MSPQHRIDAFVSRWIGDVLQAGAGVEQLFDDLQVIASRCMERGPDRGAEDRGVVHASGLQRSVVAKKQPHSFQLAAVRGPVESVETGGVAGGYIDTTIQQELRNAALAVERGAR